MTLLPATVLLCALTAVLDSRAAEVQPVLVGRTAGYVVGDILTQKIPLKHNGKQWSATELPPIGRVGLSLWRRSATVQSDGDDRQWLVMQYQVINAPQSLSVWQLPAVTVSSSDASGESLQVPPQSFTVSRFTPAEPVVRDGLGAMQPDRLPDPAPLVPLERRTWLALSALVATLLLWFAAVQWQRHRTRSRRPFSHAMRDLKTLPDNSPEAWRRLQHALNDAAGQVIRPGNLDALFMRLPYLKQERSELEAFCQNATTLFFGGVRPDGALSTHRLARRLKQLEERHA